LSATAERGLAGGFNANIVKARARRAQELEAQGKTVRFYLIGRKGRVLRRFYPQGVHHDRDMSEAPQPGLRPRPAVART
jgi:F-type H+-transporting ATPase subunit gamma